MMFSDCDLVQFLSYRVNSSNNFNLLNFNTANLIWLEFILSLWAEYASE